MAVTLIEDAGVREIGLAEAQNMPDAAARRYLQMSGPEFVQAWNEGRFVPEPDAARA
jgi:hypothetical protein